MENGLYSYEACAWQLTQTNALMEWRRDSRINQTYARFSNGLEPL